MKIENLRTEGSNGVKDLCGLALHLGSRDPFRQLQNDDGSCVGDLMCFLEDNPGCIGAIYDWISENYEAESDDSNESDEDLED